MSEAPPTLDGLLAEIRQAAAPGHPDRGKLAALRHGFGEAAAPLAWPHIAQYCDLTDIRQRAIWLTVAATAATLQPDALVRRGAGNIGATMRNLVLGRETAARDAEKTLASFDARFRRLLACQTTLELCQQLPTVVRAASAKGVAIDVRQLFEDLQDWEFRESRDVPVEWARGYWVAPMAARKEDAPCST